MYRKLDDENKVVKNADEAPEGECQCPCSEPQDADAEEAPQVKQAVAYVEVYWDING